MTNSDYNTLLDDTSMAFRLGMDAHANMLLTKIMDNILNLIQTGKLQVDIEQFSHLLKELMDSQTRGDYLYLADLLDYKLRYFVNQK